MNDADTMAWMNSSPRTDNWTPMVYFNDGVEILRVEADASITVDWAGIEAFAASRPITEYTDDYAARCLVYALLALRNGKVKEISA